MSDFKPRWLVPDAWTREHVQFLQAAAKRNVAAALAQLGQLHLEGLRSADGKVLLRRDSRTALRYLERGAALGDRDAMCSLADVLTSQGNARNIKRAVTLYQRAFRAGNTTAAYNLAITYKRLGRDREALRWFTRAHRGGDPSALFQIARAELYGIGTKRNPATALAKLRKVAASRTQYWPRSTGENVEAMLLMAEVLIEGWLCPRNFKEGIRWLRRAESWNSAAAKGLLEHHHFYSPADAS